MSIIAKSTFAAICDECGTESSFMGNDTTHLLILLTDNGWGRSSHDGLLRTHFCPDCVGDVIGDVDRTATA